MSDLIFKTGGTEIEKTKQEIEVKMNWSEHTKIQRKEMRKQIEELQEQLQKLEEISPVEEAFKRVYGFYPETYEDSWSSFQDGYIAAQKDYKVEEPEELKTLYDVLRELDKPMFTDDVCSAVKRWMSQYTHNVMTGEYLKGYEECLTVLEENLK